MATSSSASHVPTVAPEQAGILEGGNPTTFLPWNPIVLFIIQACIVIIFCQLLTWPLRLMHQPRVIAEVIGGILLGPSVFGRVPGFKEAIFPTASMPVFNNVANLGLVIFLFLVGLEVDMRLMTTQWRAALSVGVASMVIPFGLGYAIAYGLFRDFHNVDVQVRPISFGVYGLFIGTALAITAFPVLCRILTELNLLRSGVGVTTLAAGVGNDVVGWILLALCVALVNNASGLSALWALLTCIGWILFLSLVVRRPFIFMLRRTGSLHNGPTQGMVALTMLLVLTSAWFTAIIGIHPIFGAFLVGLICPHDGGFAIKLTEKIEDLTSVLFLPLYFALSGLSTDLGLLNDGLTWGYVVGVTACAFVGKIAGGTLAARASGLLWRESWTIGCLMSCKGLVELIVLNIGLQAGILSQRTFTMFVVMALVTTVATTPLVKALYPPWYQKKVEKWRRGEIEWDGTVAKSPASCQTRSLDEFKASPMRRLLVYLRLDSLPGLFTFISLLGHETRLEPTTGNLANMEKRPIEVHGLRIIELSQRTSSVMHVTDGEDFSSARDPVVNAFRTFSRIHDVAVSGRVAVVSGQSYADTLMTQASDVDADFALVPWSENGGMMDDQLPPFSVNTSERFKATAHLEFMQQVLRTAAQTCNTGVFIDNGFGGTAKPVDRPDFKRTASTPSVRRITALPCSDKSHHIFLPFFGGEDDRVALRVVLQLARDPVITATITHFCTPADTASHPSDSSDHALLTALQSSLAGGSLAGRVTFAEKVVQDGVPASLLAQVLAAAKTAVGQAPKNAGDMVIVGRRHPVLGDAVGDNANPASSSSSNSSVVDLRSTIGTVADVMVAQGVKASLLVVQAASRDDGRVLSKGHERNDC